MKATYLFFAGSLLSFVSQAQNLVSEPTGSFGGDGKDAPHLQLNDNHTFVYTDLTKPSKPVVGEGTWSLKNDEVILEPTSKTRLNRRYTVIREGMCIKTRKSFAFYTLCNCK
ncbi:hypothetical protein [Fluviicola chungangensis]|uniref:Uncharacterized protein n=1 Tax=Fluviicola chungangensis TaxID=2597671 RepID=A0A556N3F9_9FLAO|nr:hypothetical protein [Fluviicola chungangensis]TSJ46599.1 hypothetical protein FO442_05420 [Fluviicola chungangensis]